MNKFILNSITSQALSPAQRQIYHKLLANQNKIKSKRRFLDRKTLKNTIHYALSTLSDGLQALRRLGLVFYCKATKTWRIVMQKCQSIDVYDYYIKFKRDLVKEGEFMTKMNWAKVKTENKDSIHDKYSGVKVSPVKRIYYNESDISMQKQLDKEEKKLRFEKTSSN